MSLPLLASIVVIGIAIVVFAVHRTGGSKVAMLADADEARRRFAEDYPDVPTGNVLLTENGQAAFIDLGEGKTGIVKSIGGRFLTRIVVSADVEAIRQENENDLKIRFRDFTWRGGEFVFAEPGDARKVTAMLRRGAQVDDDNAGL